MSASRNQWIAVGIIVAGLGGALAAGVALSEDVFPVTVGADAPNFTAVDIITGDTLSFSDLEGQVVLLNIWATWCAPCREEMPALERLHQEMGPDGLRLVSVSVDVVDDADIRAFAEEFGLTFPIHHDRTQRIETAYQTTGLPETFVVDRHGTIVKKEIGAKPWDSPPYKAFLRRLLDASGGNASLR